MGVLAVPVCEGLGTGEYRTILDSSPGPSKSHLKQVKTDQTPATFCQSCINNDKGYENPFAISPPNRTKCFPPKYWETLGGIDLFALGVHGAVKWTKS